MKNGGNRRLFYVCFIKTLKRGIFVLTRRCSCSTIWARVLLPKTRWGSYTLKSPHREDRCFLCKELALVFPFLKRRDRKKKQKIRRKMK